MGGEGHTRQLAVGGARVVDDIAAGIGDLNDLAVGVIGVLHRQRGGEPTAVDHLGDGGLAALGVIGEGGRSGGFGHLGQSADPDVAAGGRIIGEGGVLRRIRRKGRGRAAIGVVIGVVAIALIANRMPAPTSRRTLIDTTWGSANGDESEARHSHKDNI